MMLSKTIPIIFRRENLMNKYTETETQIHIANITNRRIIKVDHRPVGNF